MSENENLTNAWRETRLACGIADEMRGAANQAGDAGLPLATVRESLRYWRAHLTGALAAVMALEDASKGSAPQTKAEEGKP